MRGFTLYTLISEIHSMKRDYRIQEEVTYEKNNKNRDGCPYHQLHSVRL